MKFGRSMLVLAVVGFSTAAMAERIFLGVFDLNYECAKVATEKGFDQFYHDQFSGACYGLLSE